mgnify:FL=1|tara:strand:- start:37 stop:504 length:468 start_codon:yes stop_codon:yes gene_type:complete
MKVIDVGSSQTNMFDENVIKDIALRRTLQFRLNFWINICKTPVSNGNYYWNTSPEHRLIAMLAISALLDQIPLYLRVDKDDNNFFTVSMARLLTHISERKIQRIIKTGIDRKDFICIGNKYSQYQGTPQILRLYKDFEKSWIDSQVLEVNTWKKK